MTLVGRCLPALLAIGQLVAAQAGEVRQPAWPAWGGPAQDFTAPAAALADAWPADGPPILWSRPLGPGYSAIVVEDGRLYTQYRVDEREAVVCLDAGTGRTIWERRYDHGAWPGMQAGYGVGPRATPLLAGSRLFTIGVGGRMLALDKSDGRILWSRDLLGEEFPGTRLSHGYSSSPTAYEDMVIVTTGAEDAALVAFDQATGDVRWKSLGFRNSFSSPRIVEVAGEAQILVFMAEELIGVDPATGALRWRYPHRNQWGHNISMPLVLGGRMIFLSSPQVGARGLTLKREGDAIRVEEIWSSTRIQFYHGSAVLVGDWAYGSSGMTSPAFLTAVNVRTGEIAWRERGFAKANCVEADGKLVILDEDGMLYLATATPEKLVVHAKTQLLHSLAWTPPTIVGRTLYARDRERVVAVDLGRASPGTSASDLRGRASDGQ